MEATHLNCFERSLLGLLVLAGVACAPSTAAAQSSAGPCADKDFPAPKLCQRARLDTLHASYLLLVDESGSMKPLWPAVRQALGEFSAAVPDGDDLEVRLFADCPHTLIPPTPASDRTRTAWQQQINGLGAPSGKSTNLGCTAEAIIEQLRSAPAGRLQFVFILTDGQHDPGAGEAARRYPQAWGGNWASLAREGEMVLQGRPVAVTLLRLNNDADRTFLSRVFPGLVVTDAIGPDALRSWFANARRRVSVSKLRLLVDRELKGPAWVLTSNEEIAAQAGGSNAHDVGVRPARSIVTTRLAAPGPFPMPGGEGRGRGSIAFPEPLPSDSLGRTQVRITGGDCAWWRPPGSCGRVARGDVNLTTKLEPADELTRIGIDPGSRPDSARVDLAIANGGALPWYLYYPALAVLVVLLAAGALRAKWATHQPYLTGRVLVRLGGGDADTASVEPQVVNFAHSRQRSYSITDPQGHEVIRLEARNERGRTTLYASPGAEPVRVGGKRLAATQQVTRTTRFETDRGDVQYFTS